ncbi:MAG: hybrid sensor histidine kinase/response regulator [Myxococcaceae bacterium]
MSTTVEEQRFLALAKASARKVWLASADGMAVTLLSGWETLSEQPIELTRDAIAQMVHPDDLPRILSEWGACLARGDPMFETEHRLRTSSGEYLVVKARGVPVRDVTGKVLEWVGLAVDVTETRRAEDDRQRLLLSEQAARADAEHANRLKDEFLARISHELATPLLGLRMWLEVLALENDRERRLAAQQALRQCIESQTQLINDLLDSSRALTGKLTVTLRLCDPTQPLDAAVTALRGMAENKGVALDMGLRPITRVKADPARLQQVLSNLLSNAIKFTPSGGRIRIRVRKEGRGVCLEVGDTGRGFPREFQPLLFAPFRQQEEGTTRTYGGLGLGLAIAQQLVELHGGKIRARSEGPGKGATFSVWLPAAGDGQEESVARHVESSTRRLQGLRVMLVEDDLATRGAVASVLEQHGARVQEVSSAREALSALEHSLPDVLLSDIAMPGEDGYGFIQRVRKLSSGAKALPAAALTAHMRAEDRERALAAGFQMHIPKSVNTAELVTLVGALAPARAGDAEQW